MFVKERFALRIWLRSYLKWDLRQWKNIQHWEILAVIIRLLLNSYMGFSQKSLWHFIHMPSGTCTMCPTRRLVGCVIYMFWQNTWNMKQPITGLKSQLLEGSQLAIQAWLRIWTQDDWEQIQEVARVGFEPRNTGLQVRCTGHLITYAASYFTSSQLKTYHVIDSICIHICRGGIVETTDHHGSKGLITHQLTKPLCCKPTNTISFQNTADNFLQKLLILTVKIFSLLIYCNF